jgi:hypothetical protein
LKVKRKGLFVNKERCKISKARTKGIKKEYKYIFEKIRDRARFHDLPGLFK